MQALDRGGAELRSEALARLLSSPIGAVCIELAATGSWLDEQPMMPSVMRYVARQVGAMRQALGHARELEVPPAEAVAPPAPIAPLIDHRSVSVYQPPSTLSFLTSRYAITLALLAILVNRIQHIVPPRRMFELRGWTRVAIRLPSIVLLSEAVLLVAGQMPSVAQRMPGALLRPDVDVQRVLWATFFALAVSCVSETFVRALDNERFRNPPFNLLSFGFLLHWHSVGPAELQPNEAVFGLMMITLAETLSLVLMETFRLRLRLVITAAFSLLGQAAMCRLLLKDDDKALLPSLQFANRFPELIVAVFTIGCSVLSQLFVDGRVSFARTFGHSSTLPDASDDFATSVIRYGSACLETSTLAGLGNELASVSTAPYIHLGRGQAGPVIMPPGGGGDGSYGLHREIRDVRAKVERPDTSDSLSRSTSVGRETMTFLGALFKLGLAVERSVARELGIRLRLGPRATGAGKVARVLRILGVQPLGGSVAAPTWSMKRWLASGRKDLSRSAGRLATPGLDDDDAEDEDFAPSDDDGSSDGSASDGEASDRGREESSAPEEGPLVLYGDLARDPDGLSPTQSASPAPPLDLLLAHMHAEGSPLTRRRFTTDMATALNDTIAARRRLRSVSVDGSDDDAANLCVVCRCEPRTIVTWPCRCLVLCDECRQHMASKAGLTHLCVTCRRPIDGFSRIFIP